MKSRIKKEIKKIKKILNGFTLVELLAVIVVLGILITISIPAINDSVKKSKKEAFVEYSQSIISKSEQTALAKLMGANTSLEDSCFMFSITEDLGLSETGDYQGWVLYKLETDKYYITLYNKDYMIINYSFSEGNSSSKQVKEKIKVYKKSVIDDIKKKVEENGINSIFTEKDSSGNEVAIDCTSASDIDDPLPTDEDESVETRVYLLSGKEFNGKIKELVSSGATYATNDTTIQYIKLTDVAPAEGVATVELSNGKNKQTAKGYLSDKTVNIYTTAETLYLPQDMSYMFNTLKALKSIDFTSVANKKVVGNVDGATSLESLFAGDMNLQAHFDLSTINTSKVTSMSYMFYNCSSMTTIDVSTFDTTNVGKFEYTFAGCTNVSSIRTENWTGINATSLSNMFADCSNKLKTIDLSNFVTSDKLINLTGVFLGCNNITEIKGLTKFNTSKVISYNDMFRRCWRLKELDLSSFIINDEQNVKMDHMFAACTDLETIYASYDWSDDLLKNDPDTLEMFVGCNNLDFWYYAELKTCGFFGISSCKPKRYGWKQSDAGLIGTLTGLSNVALVYGKDILYIGNTDRNQSRSFCALTYRAAPAGELAR